MKVTLTEITTPDEELVRFLTAEPWPFHGNPEPDPEKVRADIRNGAYRSGSTLSFWIDLEDGRTAGLIRLFDLQDPTALFDIRVSAAFRGRGVGTAALRALVARVFTRFGNVSRIEAYTRRDNSPMRRALSRCGFVKEAHHRNAWFQAGGGVYDAVGYAVLRQEWETGVQLPLEWNDGPDTAIRPLTLERENVRNSILLLQQRAYRIEAQLIGFDGIPGLHDTGETLLASGEEFYGYTEDGFLVGMVSCKVEDATLDIHRVAVDPSAFRRGIASELLRFLETRYRSSASGAVVATGQKNTPALRLYARLGYRETARYTVEPGVPIVQLSKPFGS